PARQGGGLEPQLVESRARILLHHDEGVSARAGRAARFESVRRFHTGPRLAESGLGVAQVRFSREQVAAFVAVQDLQPDERVLAVTARDPVAERLVDAA